ncbi:MAG: translation initiation factor IF-1 [Verrucomicrobiales bacterium]
MKKTVTEPIITSGTITKILGPRAFLTRLPNGKEIIAHPHKELEARAAEITPEREVTLEMTPYDFEKGRISALR